MFDFFRLFGQNQDLKSEENIDALSLIYNDEDIVTISDFEKFDSVKIAYCGNNCK